MLPIDIRNSRSLNVFERRLKLHFPSPIKMPWFSVGERFVNIHHARICIGCSKLKAHLHFNLHVEDDPSCRLIHMPLVCSDKSSNVTNMGRSGSVSHKELTDTIR